MRLNLGAGEDIRADFTNVDIRRLPDIDLVVDVRDMELPNDSVDFIVAQHLLQYIPRKDCVPLLHKWFDMLKPDTSLEIRSPNWESIVKQLHLNMISEEMGFQMETYLALQYGRQAHNYDVVLNGFSPRFLEGMATGVGFFVLNLVNEDLDFILTLRKPL